MRCQLDKNNRGHYVNLTTSLQVADNLQINTLSILSAYHIFICYTNYLYSIHALTMTTYRHLIYTLLCIAIMQVRDLSATTHDKHERAPIKGKFQTKL